MREQDNDLIKMLHWSIDRQIPDINNTGRVCYKTSIYEMEDECRGITRSEINIDG